MVNEEPLTILHVDMDAFYAAVEVRDDPSLAGKALCVGGSAEGRGVISTASYEAREFGVHSAMPTSQALRLCPDLVLVPPDFDRYTKDSMRIMEIFRRYTPLVEPISLDEAFLDVTGCERLFGDAVDVGRAIRRDILRETGLVASVGVAPTKFIAKLASDLDKPDGFRVIQRHEVREVLDPLPVSKIFGVGPRTAKRLEAMGIETIGQLTELPREEASSRFGASGAWIHDLAHGIDTRRVNPRREEKSHGMERTFPEDVNDRDELRLRLYEYCEEVAHGLRDRGLRGRTVHLKARFWNFKTLTRSRTLDLGTNLGTRIFAVARELLDRVPPGPLRLLGVSMSNLEDVRTARQGQLFTPGLPFGTEAGQDGSKGASPGHEAAEDERQEAITEGLDRLRTKYGRGTVLPASLLGRDPERGGDGRTHSPRTPEGAGEPEGED